MAHVPLDDFDRKILSHLQVDNRQPLHQIGERVNLSAAAVQRRIRRMEMEKIIEANVAVINPRTAGRLITLIVQVHLDSEQADFLAAARKQFAETPEVQQCYYVTGAADFILIVTVETMEEYAQLSHRLFLENRNVKHFNTSVAMSRVKVGLSVPMQLSGY
jgi:Lrp/AsnC family leucine-responsive transcriptional regulator